MKVFILFLSFGLHCQYKQLQTSPAATIGDKAPISTYNREDSTYAY